MTLGNINNNPQTVVSVIDEGISKNFVFIALAIIAIIAIRKK